MMNLEHAKIANHNLETEATTDVGSKQYTNSNLLTKAINYWLSEALVFAHAIACVEIVLLRSDKANKIYREVVQAWRRPGYQDILEATLPYMPNAGELFIESIRENEKNKQNNLLTEAQIKRQSQAKAEAKSGSKTLELAVAPKAKSQPKLESDGCLNDLYSDLKLWFQSDKFKQMSEHPDCQYMVKRINELILVGFNRKIDQGNKVWKVKPETPPYLLELAIGLKVALEYEQIGPQDLLQIKVKVNDKIHDYDYKMPRNPSTRKERQIRSVLIKAFKHDSFVLRHDTKLLKDADQWYKCRVNPGTIEAYVDELAKDDIYPERSNIENAIAPYDEATGYPRKWRK